MLSSVAPVVQEPALSELEAEGVQVELHDEEHLLLDNCFYVSGFIPRVTEYEEGNPMHGTQWVSREGVIALESTHCKVLRVSCPHSEAKVNG
jgi:hypothetical protein